MPTMPTHIPMRLTRIPAQPLRRQCLFQPSRPAAAPRPFAASTVRPFSASATRPRQMKPSGYRIEDLAIQHAASEQMVNPAPSVFIGQMSKKRNALADDIGLMQGTVIRAPLSQLPPVHTLKFWKYLWTLLRSKPTALYTRSVFRQCAQKKGAARYLPIDLGKNKALVARAKSLYEAIHLDLAQRNSSRLRKHCLEPLAEQITNRMAAGKAVKTSWAVKKWKSARVVSHRASPMGAERPNTAYRQVIVRLESVQHMKVTPIPAEKPLAKGPRPAWAPEDAQEETVAKPGEGRVEETKTVVDYFVIQQRVISGRMESWKAWGFTAASTPATIESDDEYWRKTVEAQTAGIA